MMKAGLKNILKKAAAWRAGKWTFAAVVLVGFLVGYMTFSSSYNMCLAQSYVQSFTPTPITSVTCTCCKACLTTCEITGMATLTTNTVYQAWKTFIDSVSAAFERFLERVIDNFTEAVLRRINEFELAMINWWETMWDYNLLPSMKAATEQLNTAGVEQSRSVMSGNDAEQVMRTKIAQTNEEVEDKAVAQPSENVCVAATNAGGFGRSTTFSRTMRRAWQEEALGDGINQVGRPSAQGRAAFDKVESQEFESTFCNPNDNGGKNVCIGTPKAKFYNADTKITENMYNAKTIQVDDPTDGPENAAMATEMVDNLVGNPVGDVIPLGAMQGSAGQEKWLERRSFLARHGAVRSVPGMITGWRMPGSQIGTWVQQLRKEAGIPLNEISQNPSYREVLRAVSVDRLNSGKYALALAGDQAQLEMEKLTINTFYLMQLRDYYELLERMALTLAVQTSVMVEKEALADLTHVKPLK